MQNQKNTDKKFQFIHPHPKTKLTSSEDNYALKILKEPHFYVILTVHHFSFFVVSRVLFSNPEIMSICFYEFVTISCIKYSEREWRKKSITC